MRCENLGSDAVTDAKKLGYPISHLADLSTITIGEQPDYLYSSDREDEQILVDYEIGTPRYTIVAAAQTEQSINLDLVFNNSVSRILRRRIQKEDEFSLPKNMRFGEQKPVNKDPHFTTQQVSKKLTQEESMTDAEALPKKNAESRNHL